MFANRKSKCEIMVFKNSRSCVPIEWRHQRCAERFVCRMSSSRTAPSATSRYATSAARTCAATGRCRTHGILRHSPRDAWTRCRSNWRSRQPRPRGIATVARSDATTLRLGETADAADPPWNRSCSRSHEKSRTGTEKAFDFSGLFSYPEIKTAPLEQGMKITRSSGAWHRVMCISS